MKRRTVRVQQPVENTVTVGAFTVATSAVLLVALTQTSPGVGSLVGIAVLLALWLYAYRVLRVVAVADDEGLLVRDWLTTHRYDWSEVEGFRLGSSARSCGKGIDVMLHRGETRTLEASFGRWWLGRGHLDGRNTRRCERLIVELRSFVAD